MHRPQSGADREGGLGQQRGDALEKIAALDAAVKVQVHVADEARLVAKVKHTLQVEIGSSSGFRVRVQLRLRSANKLVAMAYSPRALTRGLC